MAAKDRWVFHVRDYAKNDLVGVSRLLTDKGTYESNFKERVNEWGTKYIECVIYPKYNMTYEQICHALFEYGITAMCVIVS
jgi:hypothetical protein